MTARLTAGQVRANAIDAVLSVTNANDGEPERAEAATVVDAVLAELGQPAAPPPGGLIAAARAAGPDVLIIRAAGDPVTQGSMNALPQRHRATGAPVLGPGGRQVVRQVHGNAAALKPWRASIAAAARAALRGAPPLDGPCQVDAVFSLARPAGHFGTGRNAARVRAGAPRRPVASGKADLDKLVRAVLDALTEARVWHDDAQAAEFGRVAKVWAGEDPDAFAQPGALIIVRGL